MTCYYNENDPFAADWLEALIAEGLIAHGEVDRRSIADVGPADVKGYTQAHFFAGIGGWSYALRLAGWPDDQPVWSGSCPCQPFSVAGKGDGTDDPRHLWPEWRRLIQECAPTVCFGEQVASSDGRAWLATVRTDMEAMGYAFGAADLCAAGVGAPHIRQRLYFGGVADSAHGDGRGGERSEETGTRQDRERRVGSSSSGPASWVADAALLRRRQERSHSRGEREGDSTQGRSAGLEPGRNPWHPCDWIECREPVWVGDADGERRPQDAGGSSTQESGNRWVRGGGDEPGGAEQDDGMGDTGGEGLEERERDGGVQRGERRPLEGQGAELSSDQGFIYRTVYRPIEPGTFPLATGIPGRVGLLRGYGNSIVPQVGAEFVMAFMESVAGRGQSRPSVVCSTNTHPPRTDPGAGLLKESSR